MGSNQSTAFSQEYDLDGGGNGVGINSTEMMGVSVQINPENGNKEYIFDESSTMFSIFVQLDRVHNMREKAFQDIGYPPEDSPPFFVEAINMPFESLSFTDDNNLNILVDPPFDIESNTNSNSLLPFTNTEHYEMSAFTKKDDDLRPVNDIMDFSAIHPPVVDIKEESIAVNNIKGLRNRGIKTQTQSTTEQEDPSQNQSQNQNQNQTQPPFKIPQKKEYITGIDFAPDLVNLFESFLIENDQLKKENATLREKLNNGASPSGRQLESHKEEMDSQNNKGVADLLPFLRLFHGQGHNFLQTFITRFEEVDIPSSIETVEITQDLSQSITKLRNLDNAIQLIFNNVSNEIKSQPLKNMDHISVYFNGINGINGIYGTDEGLLLFDNKNNVDFYGNDDNDNNDKIKEV